MIPNPLQPFPGTPNDSCGFLQLLQNFPTISDTEEFEADDNALLFEMAHQTFNKTN
jgi:hypothetical protein